MRDSRFKAPELITEERFDQLMKAFNYLVERKPNTYIVRYDSGLEGMHEMWFLYCGSTILGRLETWCNDRFIYAEAV